jgi:putative serine protease PepD
VGLAAGILGAGLAAGAFLLWFDRGDSGEATPQIQTRIIAGTGAVQAAEVARAVLPSIVTVEVRSTTEGAFVAEASGSGVVLTADGLLVTNEHVVAGAAEVRVIFAGGRTYPAEVVGQDAVTDLAVLRIAATGLTPIALGSSENLEIGDPAIAVGSPLGLEGGPSVTVGVVSAFDRQLRTGTDEALFGLIQTDAPITRGSSGGALVDSAGRLIGITAAIGISDVGAEGLGFAIPVELMTIVTDQIIAQGRADHPFLGIKGSTYFRQEADGSTVPAGVAVDEIFKDTAAEAAGVEAGDIILSVAGEPLATMEQLVVMIRFYRVGEIVELEIDRDGIPLTIPVTLMERPEGV